jgi:peptidoglycan/xylan/chitin deacetylase (PgdA/CDA1 family)
MDRIFGSEWRPGARRLVARVGARVAPSQGPRILMYHRVFRSGHRLAVTPDLFRRHLDLFQDQGLQVVSVRDLLARVKGWGPHCVALSFDDGYLEMGELVADELKARGMGATFYVLPRFADRPEVISPEAAFTDGGDRFLDRGAIQALHRDGFEIGAHTLSHRSLTRLAPEESWREIAGSRKELSDLLGVDVPGFAYPRGHYHRLHAEQVARAGFEYAVSVRTGQVIPGRDRWELPRTEIAGGDSPAMLKDKMFGGLDLWHGALNWTKERVSPVARFAR